MTAGFKLFCSWAAVLARPVSIFISSSFMGVSQWMRVLDTVGGLIQMSTRFRRPPEENLQPPAGTGGPLGQLEARLAGVVVAALKEAFDRDRARMDLERTQMEAERERAEAAKPACMTDGGGDALGHLLLAAARSQLVAQLTDKSRCCASAS